MSDRPGERTTPTVTIRASLVRSFVVVVVALAIALLALMELVSGRELEETCRTLARHATNRVEGELQGFFRPIHTQLRQLEDWGRQGLLPLEGERLAPLLGPVVRHARQISAALVAGPHGESVTAVEAEGGLHVREVPRADAEDHAAHWIAVDPGGAPAREWRAPSDFDARSRPWFQAAATREGSAAWTPPYRFFTSDEPGLTAACQVTTPSGDALVVGLDVLLQDISEFTASLRVNPQGGVLVLADRGRVIGLPAGELSATPEARARWSLRPLEDLGLPAATAAWRNRGAAATIQAMDLEGERWWVGRRAVSLGPEQRYWILVTIPEEDFVGRFTHLERIGLVTAVAALLLAVGMSLALARSYSAPLEGLAEAAERIGRLDLDQPVESESHLHEVRELEAALNRMRAALVSFARYVPLEVVRELIRQDREAELGGERVELSLMFSDVEGFTSFSETLEPEAVTAHMGEYFDRLLRVVQEHRGTIDKLIGDAIMAFWGAPVPDEDHAVHALEAVLACREALAEMQERWDGEGKPQLPTRFGLHVGEVLVGNVGAPQRFGYTVIGDAVNLASRIESLNGRYGTYALATEDFKQAVGEGYVWRHLDRIAVKGRQGVVDVFEPLGRAGEVPDEVVAAAEAYEAAFEAACARRWDEALELLEPLGDDHAAVGLRLRVEAWKDVPPPEGWRGESRMRTK